MKPTAASTLKARQPVKAIHDAKNETKKPKKGAPAETSNRVAAAGPKKVTSKVQVPAVNDRVEVDFTDRAYVGTVLDVRTATKKHKKGGASKKTELEFEVHFDEDDERMWVSLSHLWRWVSATVLKKKQLDSAASMTIPSDDSWNTMQYGCTIMY